MPTSSSLVTNLPADFNTFGQAVDTSMSELLGGTTGQVLSKTSNTNMDFTWVTPTDQTPLTTKGDLFTFSTVDARLGVGTNGQTLVADSSTATGLKWATPAGGGGKVLQVVYANYSTDTSNSTTTYADSGLSLSITPTLNTSKVLVLINQKAYVYRAGINAGMGIRLLRGATAIFTPDVGGNEALYSRATGATAIEISAGVGLQYLDSPATTSATTYKTQFRCYQAGESASVQSGSSISSITLMEIGA